MEAQQEQVCITVLDKNMTNIVSNNRSDLISTQMLSAFYPGIGPSSRSLFAVSQGVHLGAVWTHTFRFSLSFSLHPPGRQSSKAMHSKTKDHRADSWLTLYLCTQSINLPPQNHIGGAEERFRPMEGLLITQGAG